LQSRAHEATKPKRSLDEELLEHLVQSATEDQSPKDLGVLY
jgi:hypothetical protein